MKILRRIQYWGIGAYLFFLPWQTRWLVREGRLNDGAWEFGTVGIYATDLLLLAIVLLQLLTFRERSKRISVLGWSGAAMLVVAAASYFWAVDQLIALAAVAKFLIVMALAWAISQERERVAPLLRCFVAGIVVQAGLGAYQVMTQQSWSFPWLGLAVHDPAELGTAVIETEQLRVLRAYAGLPHPNLLGGFAAIALLAVALLYTNAYRRAWKMFRRTVDRPRLIRVALEIAAYVATVIVLSAALLLSFSRSAWLGFLIGFGVLIVVGWMHRDRVLLIVLAKCGVIIALTAAITVSFQPSLWTSRFDGRNRLEQHSINDRVTQADQAGGLFERYWLVGTGLGNYTAGLHELQPGLKPWEYQPAHFTPLVVAVEFGALGFLVYLLFLFELFRRVIGVIQSPQRSDWQLFAAASLLSLFIISLFDHYVWTLGVGVALWWLMVGLLDTEK